jgi:hypothetical protein
MVGYVVALAAIFGVHATPEPAPTLTIDMKRVEVGDGLVGAVYTWTATVTATGPTGQVIYVYLSIDPTLTPTAMEATNSICSEVPDKVRAFVTCIGEIDETGIWHSDVALGAIINETALPRVAAGVTIAAETDGGAGYVTADAVVPVYPPSTPPPAPPSTIEGAVIEEVIVEVDPPAETVEPAEILPETGPGIPTATQAAGAASAIMAGVACLAVARKRSPS